MQVKIDTKEKFHAITVAGPSLSATMTDELSDCLIPYLQKEPKNREIILKEIKNATDKKRSLRHAYNDVVSTFEAYCKLVSKKYQLVNTNFQNLKSTRALFKKYGLDIYVNVSDDEKIFIKSVFEKRHAYQHSQGIITDSFIQNIPYDKHLLGMTAALSISEITGGIEILKASRIIFPLLQIPADHQAGIPEPCKSPRGSKNGWP